MANIDKLNINGTSYNIKDSISGYITGITKSNVTTALGYTPISQANYAEISIAPADVSSSTLSCVKTLTGATTASHPLVGCLTTSASTKDDQLEAFNTLLYADTGTNNITFYFSEVPSTSFTVQVVGY